MNNIFDFISMFGSMFSNHSSRLVDNYESDNFTIDTCLVTDSEYNYETAVKYDGFNDGRWMIVEQYNTESEAQDGHNRWVEYLTNNEPEYFKDINVLTKTVTIVKKSMI